MKKKQEQFLKLLEPIHDRFERFCRARVYGRSCEMEYSDLMNETLLVAFEKFKTLQSEKAFLTFLCGIAIRILSNHIKKKKEERFSSENQVLKIQDVNDQTQVNAEIHFLYEALDQLVIEQKESLILFELTGFSIKEIAELHCVSESAVKQRLKRGRENLLLILEDSSITNQKVSYNG